MIAPKLGLTNSAVFMLTVNMVPADVVSLCKRRRAILRHYKKRSTGDAPLDLKLVAELDAAFEHLKADLEDTIEGTYNNCYQLTNM